VLYDIIDADFINKWKECYDEDDIGGDDEDYKKICQKVSEELSLGTISKTTFIEILNWKTPRLKGIVRLDEFIYYEEGIKKALDAPDDQKLSLLDDLYGIGVPTASTILHIIYPSKFPIMDIRTAETLYDFGDLKKKTRSAENYVRFCKVIYNIAEKSRCTLRDVDKAVFAYHKIILEPKLKSETGKTKFCNKSKL
jgi:thermostable 8-oxoguanine DNA glycosylase